LSRYVYEQEETVRNEFFGQLVNPSALSPRSLNRIVAHNEQKMVQVIDAMLDQQYHTELTKRAIVNQADIQQMVDWAEQNAPSGSAAYRAFALAHARFCVQKLLNGIGE